MGALGLLLIYCGLVVAVSLAGGRLSSLLRMTHLRTQLLMSAVGGLMLGIALLHLLPHAAETLGSPSRAGAGGLAGLTAMFLLVRLFHAHDHGVAAGAEVPGATPGNPSAADPTPACDHAGPHHHPPAARRGRSRGISWAGLFMGLVLHTLVDGIALAASVIAEHEHGAWLGLSGLGTFLAVALHKPLDAFAITSVMNRQHWSAGAQWVANVAFSLACPIGALAFYFGVSRLLGDSTLLGWGLAVSGGFFICIALADLLPEVAFHDHDRGKLTTAFLLGVATAVAVENLPGHHHGSHHDHSGVPIHRHADHPHTGHDH